MGLFDFFKKQNKHPLPEIYKGIVSINLELWHSDRNN